MTFKTGQTLELDVQSLAFGGQGIARADGFTIFVDRAVPGQKVKVELTEVKKRFAHARRMEIIEHADIEAEPFCPYFGRCGGCLHQDMDYSAQTYWKGKQVRETLKRIGKIPAEIAETGQDALPSPIIKGYRNKMEFSISGKGEGLVVGLKKRESEEVLDIESCPLIGEDCAPILSTVRRFCAESGLPSFNAAENGYWRRLVIRKSHTNGDIMVHLITGPGKRHHNDAEKLGQMLVDEHGISSFVHSTRKDRSDIAEGEWIVSVLGNDHITEEIARPDGSVVRYDITPNAFFQTNSSAAEALFATVGRQMKLDGSETVVDLFCGAGGFGLYLADRVKSVFGIELSEEAVFMARENAKANAIGNCQFQTKNLDKGKAALSGMPESDVLIIDPPRRGLKSSTLHAAADLGAEKIIYVSCNPATLARDVASLKGKYEVRSFTPVDMFPHTHHVECVCVLTKQA